MSDVNVTHPESIRETVREGYGAIARGEAQGHGCCATSCCSEDASPAAHQLAAKVGYAQEDLAALPDGANMGLSCGNPTALAALKVGETVVDLGSGGGLDVFIAGAKIGPTGRAYGVDMTADMIKRARTNAITYRKRTGFDNVEFRLGEIEHLPLPDNSADVIISNCVINLSPDKPQVWREIASVLKPGGRVAVSDLALTQDLPEAIRGMVEALVGCVAGAVRIEDTERAAREAGLVNIVLERKDAYVDGMTEWNDPLYAKIVEGLPAGSKASDFVTSLNISATKPL